MVERTQEAPYIYTFSPYGCSSFTSVDGITYQVQLDPNLKFADGVNCTAYDVKYSYDLVINPDFGHPNQAIYSRYIDENTITINNETDLSIVFKQSYIFQESNLAIDIVPKHIWSDVFPSNHENQAKTWSLNDTDDSLIFGIGPYYLEDYNELTKVIHLKANPYWTDWGNHTSQKFQDIYFEYLTKTAALTAINSGTIDMMDSHYIVRLDEIPVTVDFTLVNSPNSHELVFNCHHPILGTGLQTPKGKEGAKYIRKAINHMIPRQTFVAEILNGLGVPGITPYPIAFGFDDELEPYVYSIDIARECMYQAGFYSTETTYNGFKIWPCALIFTAIGVVILLVLFAIIGIPIWIFVQTEKDYKKQEVIMRKEEIRK